jgi:murein DD-endopeptidase MepM/ murein hydrolase activator NlpD
VVAVREEVLGASTQVVCRAVVIAAAALLVSAATGSAATGTPRQEDPRDGRETPAGASDRALVDDASAAVPEEVPDALGSLQGDVTAQLERLDEAEAAVARAESALADAQSVVDDTEMRIEELQVQSDAVVVEAFMNPPIEAGIDVFASESMDEATVRQAILDVHAADSARTLSDLEDQESVFEEQRETQDAALEEADEARSAAEATLADLEAAVSAQARFVVDVRRRLGSGAAGSDDPAVRARAAEVQRVLDQAEAAEEYARAMEALAEAERRRQEAERLREAAEAAEREAQAGSGGGTTGGGGWACPVQGGGLNFADTWGAARSGGRTHQGTDMMAERGTPTVAPVGGTVEHRENSLGGLSWYVYGDDGNTYYGAHLNGYENVGAGRVEQGTVIGYVGTSGNAPDDAPHLHFEYQPGGGSSINPYSRLVAAC